MAVAFAETNVRVLAKSTATRPGVDTVVEVGAFYCWLMLVETPEKNLNDLRICHCKKAPKIHKIRLLVYHSLP